MEKGDVIIAIDTGEKWVVEWAGLSHDRYLIRAWRYGKRSLVWGRFKNYRLFYPGEYTY